jgi:hypothetical protein
MLLIDLPQPTQDPELGVIREARQRRQLRLATTAAALAALLAGALVLAGRGGTPASHTPALRPSSSPTRLTGPPMVGATHLRLFYTEEDVPAILDVDGRTIRLVRGLGISPHTDYVPWGPRVSLSPAPGGVLAVVERQACAHCGQRQVLFTLDAGGALRRIGGLTLASADSAVADPGAAAEWVLAHRARGGCALRRFPSAGAPVGAPCGDLTADTALGLEISSDRGTIFVDPSTGDVLTTLTRRVGSAGQLTPLPGDLALVSSGNPDPTGLALVNLATGSRTPLRWPSVVRYGYWAAAQPGGPLVALTFIDPYDAASHAPVVDIWVLDTRTASLTHVPGFPATEDFKQSDVAWVPGNRLVIAAQINPPDPNAVVGIWTPGQQTLPLRAVPVAPGGFYGFIPAFG